MWLAGIRISYTRYSIRGECLEVYCDGSDELERFYGLGYFDEYL